MNYSTYGNNYYPYNNGNYGQYTPQQMGYQNIPMQSMNQQSQGNQLLGRIVDSADMVKVTDVPFGGCAVFPKADMSEIYIKRWNPEGTTSILTYRPVPIEQQNVLKLEQREDNGMVSQILDKMNVLEEKLDNAFSSRSNSQQANKPVGKERGDLR